jgi:hypothetical protein
MDEADPIGRLRESGLNVQLLSHAESILFGEFGDSLVDLSVILADLTLPITEIIGSGGGETPFTQRLRRALAERGWSKHNFVVTKSIDGKETESTSHEVDHVKFTTAGTLGCEIEWNNKDPFFDRDLENFKRLHAEGAISVGIIITRGSSLQANMRSMVRRYASDRGIKDFETLEEAGVIPTPKQKAAIRARVERDRDPVDFADAWTDNFVSNKFGAATTHWDKLQERVARGVGNPCPLLLIGLPASIVTHDAGQVEQLDDDDALPEPAP